MRGEGLGPVRCAGPQTGPAQGGAIWRAYNLGDALRAIFAPDLAYTDVEHLPDRFTVTASRSDLNRSSRCP